MSSKILFINPNKWGRGITTIWIASHAGILKRAGHKVKLFDCTFFADWTDSELEINTINKQFKRTNYSSLIKWNKKDVKTELKETIKKFKPDIIFSSALSSHIHGEGEYINIQYAYELIKNIEKDFLLIFLVFNQLLIQI